MAFPHPQGLLPSEVAFLCEMELVTVIPRQRLERLDLLGGPTNPLIPPQRADLPLWLALLLKRQKRANIQAPAWLHPSSLADIYELETQHFPETFSPAPRYSAAHQRTHPARSTTFDVDMDDSGGGGTGRAQSFYTAPPFQGGMTVTAPATALPYHWFEMAEMLLDGAADDVPEPDTVRGLLRGIREVRQAKMRKGTEVLTGEGEGVQFDGVGAIELSESRSFITGVVDGLRKIGASREQARREREEEERGRAGYGDDDADEDEDMT